VKVTPINKGTVAEEITVYGAIVPAAGAVQTVSAPFESRVRRILVTEAQKVSQGDALLEIEASPDAKLQAEQARNDYEAAKKALDYMQQRFDLKLATNDQLLQAKQALEQAQAKLESMRRRGVDGIRTLHADVAGLISKVSAQEGAIVPAGNSLVEMVAQNRLEARLGVEPEDIDKVKLGQEVALTRVNIPGSKGVTGRVRKISRAANPTTRLVDVFVDLPSSSRFLLGEYILGKIAVASVQGLMVPRSAVLPEGDRYVLFTVKDGRAQKHTVRVGFQNEKNVEVVARDLHPGDLVVTLGNYELQHGMAVKIEESR
jgi:RND family efflux transporter MFP subunit